MPKQKILNCFDFRNETETSADLYFYGDIVSDWWGAWQDEDQYPESIKNFLSEHADKDLNIYINSGGGSVFAGIAIYNMIKRHAETHTVKVTVDGVAASIASVIAFAGSEPPKIPTNAYLMIHNPWTLAEGNAQDLRKIADDLDAITEGIVNVYADHLSDAATVEDIRELMAAETWINGADAPAYFNVEETAAVEYAAAAGAYNKFACNMPAALKRRKEAPKATDDAATAAVLDNKRAEIKRLIIKSM